VGTGGGCSHGDVLCHAATMHVEDLTEETRDKKIGSLCMDTGRGGRHGEPPCHAATMHVEDLTERKQERDQPIGSW